MVCLCHSPRIISSSVKTALFLIDNTDRLRSTNHRVRLPQLPDRFEGPNRMTRERYSIPYFMSPDPDMIIECIPSCMSEAYPAKYKPTTQAEYNKMRASMMY